MPKNHSKSLGPRRWGRRRGNRMMLRPSLLLLLAESDSHGYNLSEQLVNLGFTRDCLDSSHIYRALRSMEEEGLIYSSWDDNSKGPKKRVYRIQEAGQEQLRNWIEELKQHQKRIQHLINQYQTLF
jgi:poly-beta-hydroxybutyrate-responsive repressor